MIKKRYIYSILVISIVISILMLYLVTITSNSLLSIISGSILIISLIFVLIIIIYIIYLKNEFEFQQNLIYCNKKYYNNPEYEDKKEFFYKWKKNQNFSQSIVVIIFGLIFVICFSAYVHEKIEDSNFLPIILPIIEENKDAWINWLNNNNRSQLSREQIKEKYVVWNLKTNTFQDSTFLNHHKANFNDNEYTIFFIADTIDNYNFGKYKNTNNNQLVDVYGTKYYILGINMPENQIIGYEYYGFPPSRFTVEGDTKGRYNYDRILNLS